MKILHVINSLDIGGAEKLIVDTIPVYNERGINADVLLLNGFRTPFFNQLELKGVKLISLSERSIYNPFLIFKLIKYFKRYDIIHVHLFPSLYWVALAKFFSHARVPLIFTEHNTSNRRINKSFFKMVDSFIYKSYEKIICLTKEVKIMVLNHTGLSEDKITIIENGVDISRIKDASPIDRTSISQLLKETDKVIIQVAGFREQKDQKTLIRSISLLPEQVKLILVGDGPLKKKCEELVENLSLGKRVIFLGIRSDIPALLKASDIVILSSKYEGLSLSSIEGMASGKPFIASDVPGLTHIVEGAGILFPMGDYSSLAKKIEELLNNKQLYKEISNSSLIKAYQYDIKNMIDLHIHLYNNLMRS